MNEQIKYIFLLVFDNGTETESDYDFKICGCGTLLIEKKLGSFP